MIPVVQETVSLSGPATRISSKFEAKEVQSEVSDEVRDVDFGRTSAYTSHSI
jgi:hypothetical protein